MPDVKNIHPRQHHIRHSPAYGIAEHEGSHGGEQGECGVYPGDSDSADSDEGDDGRDEGVSVAAEAAGVEVQDGVEPFEADYTVEPDFAVGDYGIVGGEEVKEWVGKEEYEGDKDYGEDGGLSKADAGGFPAAGKLAGTVVLTYHGGIHLRHGVHHEVDKYFNVVPGGGSGHDVRAQAVKCCLDYEVGQAEYNALKSGRKADFEDSSNNVSVHGELVKVHVKHAVRAMKSPEKEQGTDQVGHNGADSDSTGSPMKDEKDDQVEKNLADAAQGESQKRCPGIADGAEYGGFKVIQKEEWLFQEQDAQIDFRDVHNFCGNLKPQQHGPCGHFPYKCERQSAEEGHGNRSMHSVPHFIRLILSDKSGQHHISPNRKPDKQAEKCGDERSTSTYGRHGLFIHKAANHGNVSRIKKLLNHPGQCQRNSHEPYFSAERTMSHVHTLCMHHNLSFI